MGETFDAPFLWYLNRTSGFVLLGLITVSAVLGVLSSASRAQRGVPTFATQLLHRNLSLLAVVLLVIHVSSAVIDTYVDIRWWQVLLPWGGTYQPLWLGVGAVAFDLILLIVLTSLLRSRMRHSPWRVIHLLSYLVIALAAIHAIGIGTDTNDPRGWGIVFCVSVLAVGALLAGWRLSRLLSKRPQGASA